EDEYSYVLEGRVGALLGDDVVVGGPGDLIFKPRGQWHTFWNAGDEPARILEVISPPASSASSRSSWTSAARSRPPPTCSASCAPATSSRWRPRASRASSSASACACRARPPERSALQRVRRRGAGLLDALVELLVVAVAQQGSARGDIAAPAA